MYRMGRVVAVDGGECDEQWAGGWNMFFRSSVAATTTSSRLKSTKLVD
jgi:hypothetical protein